MGKEYLIDSNVFIDIFSKRIPDKGLDFLKGIQFSASVITQIEVLGYKSITTAESEFFSQFVNIANIYNVDHDVALHAIQLRARYKIKLPDLLIAATAIRYDLTLITRNISDFKKIDLLQILDPYSI